MGGDGTRTVVEGFHLTECLMAGLTVRMDGRNNGEGERDRERDRERERET